MKLNCRTQCGRPDLRSEMHTREIASSWMQNISCVQRVLVRVVVVCCVLYVVRVVCGVLCVVYCVLCVLWCVVCICVVCFVLGVVTYYAFIYPLSTLFSSSLLQQYLDPILAAIRVSSSSNVQQLA